MTRPRSCEQCWANHIEMPATYHIDGSDYCEPCLRAEGYDIAKAVRIAPLAMSAAAGAGATVTVHAKDPAGFAASKALIKAAVKLQEEEAMDEKRTCGVPECETPIGPTNKSGYCQKHFYVSKKAPAKKEAWVADRACSGCGRTLRADNRSGICTPCQKGNRRAGGRA